MAQGARKCGSLQYSTEDDLRYQSRQRCGSDFRASGQAEEPRVNHEGAIWRQSAGILLPLSSWNPNLTQQPTIRLTVGNEARISYGDKTQVVIYHNTKQANPYVARVDENRQ